MSELDTIEDVLLALEEFRKEMRVEFENLQIAMECMEKRLSDKIDDIHTNINNNLELVETLAKSYDELDKNRNTKQFNNNPLAKPGLGTIS